MTKLITPKNLFMINFLIVGYFGLIGLIYIFKIENQVIGAVRELLTIPFLLAQLVFLAIGIRCLLKFPVTALMQVSVFLLGICTLLTIGSFFF